MMKVSRFKRGLLKVISNLCMCDAEKSRIIGIGRELLVDAALRLPRRNIRICKAMRSAKVWEARLKI